MNTKQKYNLPITLMKDVKVSLSEDDNVDIIKAHVISGGEVVSLTDFQKDLKERIEFADEQIRKNVGILTREQINKMICSRYTVTRDTAARYMRWSEDLYASTSPLNKAARILVRIEFCEQMVQKCTDAGKYDSAVMWESVILKYFTIYPQLEQKRQKRVQIFVLPEAVSQNGLTADAAFEILENKVENAEG